MKKQILTVAVALLTLTTMAQEKVRVHNGNDSYVTTIEQITFDVTDADQAISVGDLQKENATITQEKATLASEKANLVADTTALKAEKAKYDSFLESKGLKEEFIIYNNSENGHAYVDLGLTSGTLWATCNIGATNPEDYGDYFA